ncbi:hypothetical protein ACFIJ5_07240 [Haloimpatiens sp. FM7330]|uniref:hypothetical protein n=1 Tax=Haloimpatiens sp. FM7330 TaxID=3298610 RepID=UPI00362F83DD
MQGIIIIIIIAIIVLIVSRKNYKNRTKNLSLNFSEYNKLIRDKFYSLSEDDQTKFLNSLEKDLYLFFDNVVLGKSKKLPQNTWSLQQQMLKQQEIMKIFKLFVS